MNFTAIVLGMLGFSTAGFAKTVGLNQIGFDLQRAAFQRETKDTPVADANINAELAEALGTFGLATKKVLNLEQLVEAYAAAFVLTNRHCQTPDPDTGRKPEHLTKYLKQPAQIIQTGIDYRMVNQMNQIKATAAAIKADPTKRVEAVKAELAAQAVALTGPINKQFILAIKEMVGKEDSELVDYVVEAMTDADRVPATELKRAAQAMIDAARKRFEAGEFVMIDAGIYTLAGIAPPVKEDKATTVTPPAAPSAS